MLENVGPVASETEGLAASWWGFVEADPLIVGVVVGAVALLAIGFVALRLTKKGRAKRD